MFKKATVFSAWLLICWSVYALAQVTSTMPQLGLSGASQDFACTAAGVCTVTKTNNVNLTTNATAVVGQLPGTTTNDDAGAGKVGEYFEATAALNSVSLTALTAVNVTSQSITTGDWDVICSGYFLPGVATTIDRIMISVSSITNTDAQSVGLFVQDNRANAIPGNNAYLTLVTPPIRISLSGTATRYCVANANFGSGTLSVGGRLRGRRVR